VLTQRLFPNFSELQVRVDGVGATSRHRDAVDVAVRESTGLVREPRPCRDAVVRHRLHQIYYIFGFLFLVSMILVATCAEITILLCYFQLCNEDYAWWWRSVMSSGACAGYVFLYAVWYFISELEISGGVPSTLYFGYMTLVSGIFFLVTGTIGFYACLWFVNKIYGSIKVD